VESIDLERRFERLDPDDQETVRALLASLGDRERAARRLGIAVKTLNMRVCRIRRRASSVR
jgi:hypothetical protein